MYKSAVNRKPRRGVLPRNVYRRDSATNALPVRGTEPFCGIKAQCGACKYVNLSYELGLAEKTAEGIRVLRETGMVPEARILPAVRSPRAFEYRSLFKLAVRATNNTAEGEPRFQIGLFEPGSHDVVDMDDCPLHTVPLKRLIKDLRAELEASPITPFDEATHTGQLRYIAARAAHLTGELMVTFVVTEPVKLELRRIVEKLQRREHKINSAHMNLNRDKGNAIFGSETIRVAGSEGLRERVCDLDFEVGPTSFFQVNPWQAINLYRRVEQLAGIPSAANTVAWDLYCGTGQISLVLAKQGWRVLGIEENPDSVRDAGQNSRRNRLENRTTFLASRVEDSVPAIPNWAKSPDLIVVNPSRRGLADATRRHLAVQLLAHPRARFVYVSCEVETLARDIKALEDTGFQVRLVEPFDMFPQTGKLEWLVLLSR